MYAFISYELQTKELKWAVDQESRALGHTIQSFAEHDTNRYFELGQDSTVQHTPEFEAILRRILSQDRMVNITVRRTIDDSTLSLSKTDYAFAVPDSSESETLYTSEFEGTKYALVRYDDHAVLNVDIVLNTNIGTIYLQIVKDAEPYGVRIQELRQWIGIEILISLILGFLVCLLLTYFIKMRINKLTKESGYFLKGDDKVNLDQGTISEFNDLGSTLNILVNVFHKNMDWYRKSIQQKEQQRTSTDLSQFVKSSGAKPVHMSTNGVSVTGSLAGSSTQRLFIAVSNVTDCNLIWGCVHETDPLETALLTEAISDFISVYSDSEKTVFDATLSVFGNQIQEINQLSLDQAGTLKIFKHHDNNLSEQKVELESDKTLWIHSLDESISEKIDMYTEHSQSLSFDELFSDIKTLIGHIDSTVIIGVRRDG